MSEIPIFAELATDGTSFQSALHAGALDVCLYYLQRDGGGGAADAMPNCRAAEALLHEGRREAAVECCRRAFPWAGSDPTMLQICAWTFSNNGCHDEAAACYRALLALGPDWPEGHRHLSGSLAALGRLDEAIAEATIASDRMPHCGEIALHAGRLLADAGRDAEAAGYLDRALALGEFEGEAAIDTAELLMRCGRAEDAATLLRDTAKIANPRRLRVRSAAEMMCGRLDAALAAIDEALAAAGGNAEFHVHRGHLLWRLGDHAGAAQALARAAALDPASAEVKRAQMALYAASGLVTEATAIGGDLLHRFPDDRPAAEAVLHLLNRRLDAIDGDYVVLHDGTGERKRLRRPPPGLLDRWRAQCRVIGALIIRETRTRFGDAKLGYGWALIEPVLHITVLSVTFAVLMHGQPPIGSHFFIFYYTGLIPYLVFVHTSSGMSHAITGNLPLLQLPPVTTLDVIAARGILEVVTDVVVAVLLLLAFGAIGLAAAPDDLWSPSLALLVTAFFGCGLGCINAVITVFFRSWEKSYGQLTRVLYFISGIFRYYVASATTPPLRAATASG